MDDDAPDGDHGESAPGGGDAEDEPDLPLLPELMATGGSLFPALVQQWWQDWKDAPRGRRSQPLQEELAAATRTEQNSPSPLLALWLAERGAGIVTVRTRGAACDPDAWQKALRGRGETPWTVFVLRLGLRRMAYAVRRVNSW